MKARDEMIDLRQLGADALKEKISSAENELMNLRFRQSTTQLTKPAQLGKLRRTIARANTLLSQQALGTTTTN